MQIRFRPVQEVPQTSVSLWKIQLFVTIGMCVFTLATLIFNLLGMFLWWELSCWLTIFYSIPAVAASAVITVLAAIRAFRQKRRKEFVACGLMAAVTVAAAVLNLTVLGTWFW